MIKQFIPWANANGYDTAHTYDTERSRWVFFNPMTIDLWKCWQDCAALVAAHQRELDAKVVEALEAKYPCIEGYEDTGDYIAWEISKEYDDKWIDQDVAAAAIRGRKL